MVLINQKTKTVVVIECSCPWITNMQKKEEEKTEKYREVRAELQRRYEDFHVDQINVLLDVMGGYTKPLKASLVALLGQEKVAKAVLKRMQKQTTQRSAKTPNWLRKLEKEIAIVRREISIADRKTTGSLKKRQEELETPKVREKSKHLLLKSLCCY